MIHRYENDAIREIWLSQRKFETWVGIEHDWYQALWETHVIPVEDEPLEVLKRWPIGAEARSMLERWKHHEDQIHHDVEAMVMALTESLPQPGRRWVHYGLTSSNIVDTWLLKSLTRSTHVLRECNPIGYFEWPMNCGVVQGYTHGQQAEPVFGGRRLESWFRPISDSIAHISRIGNVPTKMGGPTNQIDPELSPAIQWVAAWWNTSVDGLMQGQCVDRGEIYGTLARFPILLGQIEKVARDWWFLISIGDLEFQGITSSSMPHKSNPSELERLWGFAAMGRGMWSSLLEVLPTTLERDLAHSSVERVCFPDLFHLAATGLSTLGKIGPQLRYTPQGCRAIVGSHDLFKQFIQEGHTREEARRRAGLY